MQKTQQTPCLDTRVNNVSFEQKWLEPWRVVAAGRASERGRGFLVESLGTFDAKRATVSANISGRRTEVGCNEDKLQQSAPTPPAPDANSELRQLRETVAELNGQLHPELRGGVGVDRRTTSRSSRGNGGGGSQTKSRHHVPGSSAVAARSFSWSHAIYGDKLCELRLAYGLRGVRVGEASHQGLWHTSVLASDLPRSAWCLQLHRRCC